MGLALGLAAAACSSTSAGTEQQVSANRAPMQRATTATTVAANSQLATDLYHQLAAREQNFSFSPYAASIALAQVGAGAAGATATQLTVVQHVGDQHQLEAGLNTLMQQVASRDGDRQNDTRQGHVTVQIPIAVWGQLDTHVSQPFLNQLARWFGAGMHLVDFRSDPDAAGGTINTWMADQTANQLTRVVPTGQTTQATRLITAAGTYIAAPWDQRFDVSRTRQDTFHLLNGSTQDATTMSLTAARGLLYDRGPGWQAVMVPYLGRQLAMVLIIPDQGSFASYESHLDGPALQAVLEGLAPTPLNLEMPRFQVSTNVDLRSALTALGATSLFDPASAQLPGITTDEPLSQAAADQVSYLSADEEGSQASAPTAVVAQPPATPATVSLRVDRPFLVTVVDRASGEPLLLGRIVTP